MAQLVGVAQVEILMGRTALVVELGHMRAVGWDAPWMQDTQDVTT